MTTIHIIDQGGIPGSTTPAYVVACGPLLGSLPGYDDDCGNWTEPLGLVSLVVEGTLLVLAARMYLRDTLATRHPAP